MHNASVETDQLKGLTCLHTEISVSDQTLIIIIIIIIMIMILFLKRFSMLNMLNCAVQCSIVCTHTHARAHACASKTSDERTIAYKSLNQLGIGFMNPCTHQPTFCLT